MKIYFAASIRAGQEDKDVYLRLINHLKKFGEVLTEHIIVKEENGFEIADHEIYDRDFSWLKDADVFVAEVTTPSLGVGYELGKVEELKKKHLCLYRKNGSKQLSAMIAGNKKFNIKHYEELEHAFEHINEFFGELSQPP